MNQRTHTWIAIRAIALLEDKNEELDLQKLLKPHLRKASVGAWIPDQVDAKRGGAGSATENHIFKMVPYNGAQKNRFITNKENLLDNIGTVRASGKFIKDDQYLDEDWWNSPYQADISKPGMHLPNRTMALGTTLKDLLLLGDKRVDQLIPGDIRFAQYMDEKVRTKEGSAAMYFFIISHFIADVSMPCHCDGRKLAAYSWGLHKELEHYWSRKVGTGFEKKKLCIDTSDYSTHELKKDSNQILNNSRLIDEKFGLKFDMDEIPDLINGHDIWLEMVFLARISFAINSIIAPYKDYPYGNNNIKSPFDEVLGTKKPLLLKDINRIIMHDAILNTAIIWKHIWNKVSKN